MDRLQQQIERTCRWAETTYVTIDTQHTYAEIVEEAKKVYIVQKALYGKNHAFGYSDIVAYVRHHLTDYDECRELLSKRVGAGVAYDVLKDRYNSEIKKYLSSIR